MVGGLHLIGCLQESEEGRVFWFWWVKSAPWNRMKFDGGLNCMAIYIYMYVLFHYLHASLSKCQTCL